MKILLAVDGSANSDLALARVTSRIWPDGSECKVVTVNEPWSSKLINLGNPQLTNLAEQAHKRLQEDLRELLADTAGQLSEKFGADKVSAELLEGKVKDRLFEVVNAWGADLIVLGGPGGEGVNEAGSGKLTQHVVSDAPCSVLVVRPIPAAAIAKRADKGLDPTVESRFLVALNDSANSRAVLDMIAGSTWPQHSIFQVLTISEPVRMPVHARLFKAGEIQELADKASEVMRKQAEDYAQRCARELEAKLGAEKVTFHALEGNARSLILQIAQDWPADTILMGAEDDVRTVGEVFFGSTAQCVLALADCSVQYFRTRKG
jgi:nucleotide-binding universal stress UspA family protein